MREPGDFVIEVDELDDVVGDLEACERDFSLLVADLERQMVALHGTWEGLAATAQREAHQESAQAMAAMPAALSELRAAAGWPTSTTSEPRPPTSPCGVRSHEADDMRLAVDGGYHSAAKASARRQRGSRPFLRHAPPGSWRGSRGWRADGRTPLPRSSPGSTTPRRRSRSTGSMNLVDAFATLCGLAGQSHVNHRRADIASVFGHPAPDADALDFVPGTVDVRPVRVGVVVGRQRLGRAGVLGRRHGPPRGLRLAQRRYRPAARRRGVRLAVCGRRRRRAHDVLQTRSLPDSRARTPPRSRSPPRRCATSGTQCSTCPPRCDPWATLATSTPPPSRAPSDRRSDPRRPRRRGRPHPRRRRHRRVLHLREWRGCGGAIAGWRVVSAAKKILSTLRALEALAKARAVARLTSVVERVRPLRKVLERLRSAKRLRKGGRAAKRGEVPHHKPPRRPGDPLDPATRPPTAGADWEGRVTNNGKGEVWQRPGASRDSDCDPNHGANRSLPIRPRAFQRQQQSPSEKLDGKTSGNRSQHHIRIRPDGTYPIPKGWNP